MHVHVCVHSLRTQSQSSSKPLSPVELAGLVAQVNGRAAPRPEVVACDRHHGASRLRPSDGVERHHRRALREEAETWSRLRLCPKGETQAGLKDRREKTPNSLPTLELRPFLRRGSGHIQGRQKGHVWQVINSLGSLLLITLMGRQR